VEKSSTDTRGQNCTYNLRKCPTKCTERVSMTQTGQVTGVEGNIMTIHPETHSDVMLTG